MINPYGGAAQSKGAVENLQQLLATRLAGAHVDIVQHGAELADRARAARASGANVIAAAGGDGTLSAVAQALVGSDVRFGVLPFGTRNHFARDIGLLLDLGQAVDLLKSDLTRRIDVGSINGRYFLNNASIGLYPELVELRNQEHWTASKLLQTIAAARSLARAARSIPIELHSPERTIQQQAWTVFVGNNSYSLNPLKTGRRTRLDAGVLEVIVVPARVRWMAARLAVRAARGHTLDKQSLHLEADQATLRLPSDASSEVAIDGEVMSFEQPLSFCSVPKSLSTIAPMA
ncbi:MAG TPA: diacylglycerol kinase family protein [Roseiflexaceae bacterium]|nr:diacylglycerol kinase family protein [Roseiflexaceae bacterium]